MVWDRKLYEENIIDHYKRPRNHKVLDSCSAEAVDENLLCGDRVRVQLKIEDGKIADIGFQTEGCVICTASASMLSEEMLGKSLKEAEAADERLLLALLGIEPGPARRGCAMLPLKVFKLALYKYLNRK
ncbi:MAG: iron-sulfur cluster assembly scaffold protein [Candidatus Anstonellaceae archaeon]